METLEHFAVIFPVSLRRSVYSGSLRGRLHRYAMETCSARIDPHTVFALAPVANRLKNALGHAYTITLSSGNQSDFDKIIQTKRAEACIAEDQGALRERQWMESAQAVYPNPQACASIDCDCSGKRRARPGSPERAPLANRQDGE